MTAVRPRSRRPVRGADDYAARILGLLALAPDLRVALAEQAVAGDVAFLRWTTRRIGPDGPFKGIGTDRIRVRGDGRAADTLAISDMPVFEALARAAGG